MKQSNDRHTGYKILPCSLHYRGYLRSWYIRGAPRHQAPFLTRPLPADAQLSGRRSMLQSYGRATGAFSGAGSTQSDDKNYASGDICYISSDTSAQLDCRKQGVGTYVQQVPSCCSSTSHTSDNSCSSFDTAGTITCSNVRRYPACCEFRSVPDPPPRQLLPLY